MPATTSFFTSFSMLTHDQLWIFFLKLCQELCLALKEWAGGRRLLGSQFILNIYIPRNSHWPADVWTRCTCWTIWNWFMGGMQYFVFSVLCGRYLQFIGRCNLGDMTMLLQAGLLRKKGEKFSTFLQSRSCFETWRRLFSLWRKKESLPQDKWMHRSPLR